MNNFATILKTYRQRERLSQTELAKQLEISRNYVSLIERGVNDNISWRLGCKILNLEHAQVKITIPRYVMVDATIAPEIALLNRIGIETEGSCQGPPPTAMIRPSSAERARTLGYDPQYREDVELFEVALRSTFGNSKGIVEIDKGAIKRVMVITP